MSNTETTEKSITGEDDFIFAAAVESVDELYFTRDTYFSANPLHKISKLQELSTSALNLLDSIPLESRKSQSQRAMYEYLRGKILDALPHYKKEAEDHLAKAVKLNPTLGDAWLSLGNCIWKKGELMAAKNCMYLALKKCRSKRILCQLSMLLRKMAQENGASPELVEETIKLSREAVSLDVKDGYTWYNLGNTLLFAFFVTGQSNPSILQQSLKAYINAERDDKMKSNPDLCYNSSTVNKFLENYERALSGYEAAALKDPGLNAAEEVQNMVGLLDKVDSLLSAHIKAKRLASLKSSLHNVKLIPPYRRASIDILQEGVNKAVAIVAKVLFFIKHENVHPLYYLVCDSNQTCFVVSVYKLHNDAIKEGDQVTILDPCYRHVNFSWKGKQYQFESVRVDFVEQIRVNGTTLTTQRDMVTSIYAQHKP